jgi:predicted transcriptional regulator of viral defense system
VKAALAIARLRDLGVPVVTTADAAAALRLSTVATSQALGRLDAAGVLKRVRKGLWSLSEKIDPLALAEHVTQPYPSYISLQTALYLHGMIDQIPATTYVVSLGRTAKVRTSVGTFSIHQVAPEFFGGAFLDHRTGVRLASPEKALVDTLYLSSGRSRLFARLPELELPASFRAREARRWAERIPSRRLRTIVEHKLENVLAQRRR